MTYIYAIDDYDGILQNPGGVRLVRAEIAKETPKQIKIVVTNKEDYGTRRAFHHRSQFNTAEWPIHRTPETAIAAYVIDKNKEIETAEAVIAKAKSQVAQAMNITGTP